MLHNINFLHIANVKVFPRRRVLDLAFAHESNILARLKQPLPSVYPSIWQYDRIIFDIAFRVMSIWHIAG